MSKVVRQAVETWAGARLRLAHRYYRRVLLNSAIGVLATVSGCSEDRRQTMAAEASADDIPVSAIAGAPLLEIGSVDGEVQFTDIIGAIQMSDGRIVVADRSPSLLILDAEGQLLNTVDAEGAGPGEFRRISGLQLLGDDSVVVFDPAQQRASIFGADGGYGRMIRSNDPRITFVGYVGDNALLAARIYAGDQVPASVTRRNVEFGVMNIETNTVTTVTSMRDADLFRIERASVYVTSEMMRRPLTATGGGRIFIAESDKYEIVSYDPSGQLDGRISRSVDPVRMTAEDVVASLPRRMRDSITVADIGPIPEDVNRAVIAGLLVDTHGRLWVEESRYSDSDVAAYTVFDENGVPIQRVSSPPRFQLLFVGAEVILGASRDTLSVARLQVYPLPNALE